MIRDETMAEMFDSLPHGSVLHTFMQYSAGDPRINRSREILPKEVGGGIFDGFL